MSFAEVLTHDRGLGSAYERYYFYRLLDRWAAAVGAESFLEGPLDGMAGIPGVHGVGLAKRGVRVMSVVRSQEQAETTRRVYGHAGVALGDGTASVTVGDVGDMDGLPKADLVLAYHALSFVPDWREYLERVARLARKAFIVTVCNPENWGVEIIAAIARLRGIPGMEPPDYWRTESLAPVLWNLGRVREHEFFDCPWWPDLQVSPGQSLLDRAKKLVWSRKKDVSFTAEGGELAQKFVYGEDRWPYFGQDGFVDELEPALRRHPAFETSRHPRLRARAGHLHAFLVDVSPRTPQEKRRLRLETA